MKTTLTFLLCVGIASSQVGCASLVGESLFTDEQEGRFLLSSDAEGLRAFSDGLNGLIVTGKSTPDTPTDYFDTRREFEKVRVMKFQARKTSVAAK